MASTNKTVNYELSQFEGTDKPSWEADYNADMLIIDTNMKAISDVANGASGDISTLDGRLTTAEGNITTNANDIDALEARAEALEAGQTSDDGRLDALEAEQIVQNTAIESNTRLGYNLARPYDSASTYAVGAYVLFQDTLYKCTTAIATGEAFDPTKWLAIKATDEIAAGGYTLPTASASTLGGVKVGNNLSIDANGELSAPSPYTLPTASANDLGGVKVGNNLSIDANGVLSASSAPIYTAPLERSTDFTLTTPTGVTLHSDPTNVQWGAIRVNDTVFFSMKFVELHVTSASTGEKRFYFNIPLPAEFRPAYVSGIDNYVKSTSVDITFSNASQANIMKPAYAEMTQDANNYIRISFGADITTAITSSTLIQFSCSFIYKGRTLS